MNNSNYPIPPIMQHLKVDERGYPIPYFTPLVGGKPDFRYQDVKKRDACIKYNKCSICGNELYRRSHWFLTGPMGLENRIASDYPAHEDCARYALNVCPHIVMPKAKRRSDPNNPNVEILPGMIEEKPNDIFLVKADKIEIMQTNHGTYIKFRPIYSEQYSYVDGKLTRVLSDAATTDKFSISVVTRELLVADTTVKLNGWDFEVGFQKEMDCFMLRRSDGKFFMENPDSKCEFKLVS